VILYTPDNRTTEIIRNKVEFSPPSSASLSLIRSDLDFVNYIDMPVSMQNDSARDAKNTAINIKPCPLRVCPE